MERPPNEVGTEIEGEMPAHLQGTMGSFQSPKLPEFLEAASKEVDDLVEKSGLLSNKDFSVGHGHVERMNELSDIINTNPDKEAREQAKKEYEQLEGSHPTKNRPVEYGSK